MLATLLLALLAQAATPPADDPGSRLFNAPGFCRDLTALIAASAETPAPFASLTSTGKADGERPPGASLDGMRWCRIARYAAAAGQPAWPTLHCGRDAWGPVAESRLELARAVQACTAVAPSTEPDDRTAYQRGGETRFETAAWTLTVTEQGCDRCKGMPRVELRLTPRAPLP